MPAPINVLFLASEAEPFVKIGGLGDVGGALPRALRVLTTMETGGYSLDVRLVLPLHATIQTESHSLQRVAGFDLLREGKSIPVEVFLTQHEGLPVYFISGEPIQTAPTVYSNNLAADREKYSFFSLAALELIHHLNWRVDILHANDWHTALALYALKSRRTDPVLQDIKGLLTLHNLPYMGGDGLDVLQAYGLSPVADESLPIWARSSPLPLGLWAADSIVAVSPGYSREILTPEFGCSLEDFLRKNANKLTGILNGIDTASNDPETDPALAARFTATTLDERLANKCGLQKQLGLPVDGEIPIFGMVGRIDPQKGVDLALEALRQIPQKPWQAVLLGSGTPDLEAAMCQLQTDHPNRVGAVTRYDAQLGRMIYGGADIFMMPSRYEPCGLAQMLAMRYGCVPVVRATGGLKDTVKDRETGFHVPEATAESLAATLLQALKAYAAPERWRKIQQAGMRQDFSWRRSARQYATLYKNLIEN